MSRSHFKILNTDNNKISEEKIIRYEIRPKLKLQILRQREEETQA